MRHIKQMDILTKQLAELATCIHWFNPLAHLLKIKVDIASETSNDEFMMKNSPPEDKNSYGKLIVDNLVKSEEKIEFSSTLTKAGKRAEKRILKIMFYVERPLKNKIFMGLLIVALILANSLTAFAYPLVAKIEMKDGTIVNENFDINSTSFFVPNDVLSIYDDEIVYENQFIDEEGNIYNLDESGDDPLDCEHSYLSGTLQTHQIISDGSCIVITYEAQMCEHCKELLQGNLLSESTNMVCKH